MEKKSISKDTLIKIISIAVAVVLCITGVTLWLTYYHPFDESYKTVTVEIVDEVNGYNKTFYIRTNAASLADLIDEKEEWRIIYSGSPHSNMYITGVNGITAPNGYWVSLLTSDTDYQDTASPYKTEYTAKNGALCITTPVGASSLPLVDGETYVIIVIAY